MNATTKRTTTLVVVLVLIAAIIWYLESGKAGPGPSGVPVAVGAHSANFAANSVLYSKANEFVSPDGYINTPATTTLDTLINQQHRVVLVDFWTYSCINCMRTIPYLEAWYQKYKNYGFTIVGVHAPEFAFEKVLANVQAAVQKFGITYPVILDSNLYTWGAYHNQYWPAEYLIDTDGLVREHSIGEGNYEETESAIQKLLAERNQTLGLVAPIPTGFVDVTSTIQTASPETYFGFARNQYLGNGAQQTQGTQTLVAPALANAAPNTLYLGGMWNFGSEYAENISAHATITYHYSAKDVYLVASAAKDVTLTIYVDGKIITANKGADVDVQGQVHVQESRLYKLVEGATQAEHVIEIKVSSPGLDAYTFTFG
ncbi:MAG: redoxin domain-containing protein [Candidatus Adlerbacteria bacterium]|nr:redoxin domain-containing protein [Candidatus Adlerbacteria bacterium]